MGLIKPTRRAFIVGAGLAIASPAIVRAGWFPLVKGSGNAAATTNFLARTSGLSGPETTMYTNLINGLVTDGFDATTLAPLDGLYWFATNNSTTGKLNLCGNTFNLTEIAGGSWTADVGWTGDGSTGYFDTGFTPSSSGGNQSLNSQSMGGYQTAGIWNNYLLGSSDGVHGQSVLSPSSVGGFADLNSSGSASMGTTRLGNFVINRTGSGSYSIDLNEANLSTPATASSSPSTSKIFISALSVSGGGPAAFNGNKIIAAWFGGGLSGTVSTGQRFSIAHRLNAAAIALGINIY